MQAGRDRVPARRAAYQLSGASGHLLLVHLPAVDDSGVTAAVTTLQTPVTFFAAVQTGDLLKAIGITDRVGDRADERRPR